MGYFTYNYNNFFNQQGQYTMNPEQYQTYKESYPNFDQDFVRDIPLDQIQVSHKTGQVRTNGKDKDHLLELKQQIDENGQSTPVSLEQLAEELFDLTAGEHRLESKLMLHEEYGGKKHNTIRAAFGFPELMFSAREDKVIFQLNENTPPAQLACDIDDYVQPMVGLIRDDYVLGSDLSKVTPEQIRAYLRAKIKNLSNSRAKTIAKRVMKGIPSGKRKFRNFATKQEAAKHFTEINPWGLSVSRSGESDQGYIIYFAESLTAIQQNNVHGAFNLKRQDRDKKVLIVAYCGNVLSKTPDINKWRRDAVAKFKEENNAWFLPKDFTFFDGIVFLPQVLLGQDQEDEKLIINPLNFKA